MVRDSVSELSEDALVVRELRSSTRCGYVIQLALGYISRSLSCSWAATPTADASASQRPGRGWNRRCRSHPSSADGAGVPVPRESSPEAWPFGSPKPPTCSRCIGQACTMLRTEPSRRERGTGAGDLRPRHADLLAAAPPAPRPVRPRRAARRDPGDGARAAARRTRVAGRGDPGSCGSGGGLMPKPGNSRSDTGEL